jgi:WD40 repeat protein|eukprot:COSAG01_NODE_2764_length_7112_cov_593.144018_10_plen_328_part_00
MLAHSRLQRPHGDAGLSINTSGELAAIDSRRSISLVRLSDPTVVRQDLRHNDRDAHWNVGSNVRWCNSAPNEHLLASTCHNVAFIWDPNKGSHPVVVLREHRRSVNSICWHPFDESSTALATCSADSYIHLWDIRTPQRPALSFCAWTAGATKIEWSLSDENVLASSHDNEVRLWDRRRGSLSQVRGPLPPPLARQLAPRCPGLAGWNFLMQRLFTTSTLRGLMMATHGASSPNSPPLLSLRTATTSGRWRGGRGLRARCSPSARTVPCGSGTPTSHVTARVSSGRRRATSSRPSGHVRQHSAAVVTGITGYLLTIGQLAEIALPPA